MNPPAPASPLSVSQTAWSKVRLRDKDYVRTKNGLLFNVTGYDHPESHIFGSLKYVSGKKWTAGYAAAKQFLTENYSGYVDQFIRVPKAEVDQCFLSRRRWEQLQRIAAEQPATLGALHREALALGAALRAILKIPESALGITDSLLWGEGHAASDIDLVVLGLPNISQITSLGNLLYSESADFRRPNPDLMRSPYGLNVEDWPRLLKRKVHMGSFCGRLFSVRGVLDDGELDCRLLKSSHSVESSGRQAIEFEVVDVTESLLFPAVYRNAGGDELVDYSVVYEGVFRPGDLVRCSCDVEKVQEPERRFRRYTMIGAAKIRFANESLS